MFDAQIYLNRRKSLHKRMGNGLILFAGNELSSINYKDNTYPFRQDSSFLYYFGIDVPNIHGLIDLDQGQETIFGRELSMDDIVWEGNQPTMGEKAQMCGVAHVLPPTDLQHVLHKALKQGRKIHYLPPYRPETSISLHQLLNIALDEVAQKSSLELIQAVVAQRSIKAAEEVAELHKAGNISRNMHLAAMKVAKAGIKESEVAAAVYKEAIAAGGTIAYPIILTVNGQTLHNHYHGNTLQSGQMVLIDAGAETSMHYAGDITRSFPVDAQFSSRQKEIYQIVLDTENAAKDALKPGLAFKDIHLMAAKMITDGLKSLALMKGDTEEAVQAGAHALFFPHGLGHMMGLDVHDMENLGEDYVGYNGNIVRNPQFGLKSLRLGRILEKGFVLTVEPGIYFIPELIDQWKAADKFKNFINYQALEPYKNFSGIRIEENFLITDHGAELLGQAIPKTIHEVENIRVNSLIKQ